MIPFKRRRLLLLSASAVMALTCISGCRDSRDSEPGALSREQVATNATTPSAKAQSSSTVTEITGTDGDDALVGTEGDDVINAGAGDDYIVGDPVISPTSETAVVYGTAPVDGGNAQKDLLLDIYQSGDLCTAYRPYVLIVHGGGFVGGSRTQSALVDIANALTQRGYVAISIDYRLTPDVPVPSAAYQPIADALNASIPPEDLQDRAEAIASAIEDAITAIRWIEANDLDRCIDTSRYAILGGSAGAFIGMNLTYGVDGFGISIPAPEAMVDLWGGVLFTDTLAFNDPPLMIVHGTNDTTVSHFTQAIAIEAEAIAQSIPYTFFSVTGGVHGFPGVGFDETSYQGQTLFDHTIDFIDAHLGGGTPTYLGRINVDVAE